MDRPMTMTEKAIEQARGFERRILTSLELARIHGPAWKVEGLEDSLAEIRADLAEMESFPSL